MADNNVLFRTSVGGFNKKDVLEYIDKQNADFGRISEKLNMAVRAKDEELLQLKKTLERQTDKADALRRENEEALRKCDGLELELCGLNGQLSEKDKRIAELENEVKDRDPEKKQQLIAELKESMQRSLDEKDREIERLKSQLSSSDSENERKAELYDGMSAQIGDLLITANKNAENIIKQATENAQKINDGALQEAEQLRKAFSSKMARISSNVTVNTKSAADNYRTDVLAELEELRDCINNFVSKINERSAAFDDRFRAEIQSAETAIQDQTEALKNGI